MCAGSILQRHICKDANDWVRCYDDIRSCSRVKKLEELDKSMKQLKAKLGC